MNNRPSVIDDIKAHLPSLQNIIVLCLIALISLSLAMIASASLPYANANQLPSLHYFYQQLGFLCLGVLMGFFVYRLPSQWLFARKTVYIAGRKIDATMSMAIFVLACLMLALTLAMPAVNGAHRWIKVLGFNFQASEFLKVAMVLIIADYMATNSYHTRHLVLANYINLAMLVGVPFILLLLQPDFGTFLLLIMMVLAMFWVAGARKAQYWAIAIAIMVVVAQIALGESYRRERIYEFLDPFDKMQGADYQPARSLIAYARGEWFGTGYGQSVQKMAHLPEAHTDFLLSITGEELGFVGVASVIVLQSLIVFAMFRISYLLLLAGKLRLCYMCFGYAVIIVGQSAINAGMTLTLLPTKGLTFPFFSYGGSALVTNLMMVGLVLRAYKMMDYDGSDARDM